MKYAIIENNIVTNIIDIEESVAENIIASISQNSNSAIDYISCGDDVKIGDEYLGEGKFNLFQTPDDRIDELQEKYNNFECIILTKMDELASEISQLQEVVTDLILSQSKAEDENETSNS